MQTEPPKEENPESWKNTVIEFKNTASFAELEAWWAPWSSGPAAVLLC